MKKKMIAAIAVLLLAAALTGCGELASVPTTAPSDALTAAPTDALAADPTAVPETTTPVESVAPTPAAAPAYSAAPQVQYGGDSSSYESSDDPYNAKDYSGADDFYDDHYDDFDSYEDAESYWEDNAG